MPEFTKIDDKTMERITTQTDQFSLDSLQQDKAREERRLLALNERIATLNEMINVIRGS